MTDTVTDLVADIIDPVPPASYGSVTGRAQRLGYVVVQLHSNPDAGYWLARSHSWVSYEPGRTLDELRDQLEVIAEQRRIDAEQRRAADELQRLLRLANADAIRSFAAYSAG